MKHGPNFDVLGFRVGNVAYCTDVSEIPDQSMQLLQGLDTLVLDALRPEGHITHMSIDQAVEVAQHLKSKTDLLHTLFVQSRLRQHQC